MAEGASAGDRLTLFVSYSRRDMETADRLVSALEDAGFAVTIDRRDLPYGEEWQNELADFIRASDTVIWLVSQHSVKSRWCNWELAEVRRLNKRLLPVAVEAVAPEDLPEALGRIHVLPAEGAFDFDTHMPVLVEALNTDRAWLKEHTRLADRARQWLARGRPAALLLRGVALKDAQAWSDKKPPAAPSPSDEILELLLASRRAQGRRQRLALVVSALVAIVGVALAGLAYWQRGVAVEQKQLAEYRAVAEKAAKEEAQRNFHVATATMQGVFTEMAEGLQNVEGVPIESRQRMLDAANKAAEPLFKAVPDDPGVQRIRAAIESEFGSLYLLKGDGTAASAAYDKALKIARDVVAQDPNDWQSLGILSLMLGRVGDFKASTGDSDGALAAYDEALLTARRNTELRPDNTQVAHDLSLALENMADFRAALGDTDAALKAEAESIAIRRQLVAGAPDDKVLKRDLSVGLVRIGNFDYSAGDMAAALSAYQEALSIRRGLAEAETNNTQWQADVASALDDVAAVETDAGKTDDALAAYEEALSIRRRLVHLDPENTEWTRDVSVSLDNVAALKLKTGDRDGAAAAYDESLAISRRLAERDPTNLEWQNDVAIGLNKVGGMKRAAGDMDGALAAYQESLAILRKLADSRARQGRLAVGRGGRPRPDRRHAASSGRQRRGAEILRRRGGDLSAADRQSAGQARLEAQPLRHPEGDRRGRHEGERFSEGA